MSLGTPCGQMHQRLGMRPTWLHSASIFVSKRPGLNRAVSTVPRSALIVRTSTLSRPEISNTNR